jgi:hypothetical protein
LFKVNNKELLNKFKQYSLQDSITLFKALIEAQKLYISLYNIDITSILSTSTLSLKIFRQNFLEVDIPILKGSEDQFIRNSYFGGATDYYKGYIKNGYYYDVNSLYPFAMLKPMPHKIIKYYKDLSNIKLDNFFGFCLAEITTPKKILKPLLPYKYKGKTIFPTGSFIGVYFSEELKAVQSRGYQITLISGYEYSKIFLFTKYVEHFYNKKKNSFGAERFIAKMHLNQLYGIFGRKKDLIQTINIYKKDLPKYITTKIIKTIININSDIVAILIQNNINVNIIKKLNIFFDKQFISNFTEVKNNVAIASAVTAYSRIHIMSFKENPAVAYTDTDSIFTTDKLPNNLIGKDIGLMKDELEGNIIQEAYFLDIKKYGYWYKKPITNQIIETSVFAGVTRNSLSFNEIRDIFNGKIIVKDIPVRFYKTFKDLSIAIKPTKVTIKKTNDKVLIDNHYLPINIFNLNHQLDSRTSFIKIKNKIIKFFKHYLNLINPY